MSSPRLARIAAHQGRRGPAFVQANKNLHLKNGAARLSGRNAARLAARQQRLGALAKPGSAKFARATFAPGHALNLAGGNWWKFRHHRRPFLFFGWVGPVFWPFAYTDLFEYTFWPYGYDDYYWAYVYDEIFETIFVSYPSYATTGYPRGRGVGRHSVRQVDNERTIAQLCGEQARGVTEWPLARIERAIQLNDAQRAALAQLKEAAAKAHDALEASCPRDVPSTPPGRLDVMRLRLEAMLEAVRIVRPALENFYNSLSEEQKARFNALGPQVAENKKGRAPERETQSDMTRSCEEPKPGLVDMPVDRIARAINPTPAQLDKLDELKKASAEAVETLRANCPTYTALTPAGRLEAMEKRLTAMVEAVRKVQPAVNDFYNSLNDDQKRRLNTLSRAES